MFGNFLSMLSMIFFCFFSLLMQAKGQGQEDQPTIYVYAYSWTPGFCNNQKSYPGCVDPLPYWETNFTIHGLWPQFAVNGYPDSCTKEPFDTTIPQQIGESTMIQYWPDVKYNPDSSSYDSFWEHEWTKHGTCSGLTQLQYFQSAIQLTNQIPSPTVLYDSIGGNMSATVLREHMGGPNFVTLLCTHSVLNGLYTCWEQVDHLPTVQIKCPQSVIQEDTCLTTSDEIIIL